MACLIDIYRPPCCKCDELATVKLVGLKGVSNGVYCARHGQTALTQLHAFESETPTGKP